VLALILLVVSIGLADSLNPSTLAPALVLATGRDAERQLLAFTFGVFAVSFAGGLAILLGPGTLLLDALPHPDRQTRNVVEVVGGLLLLALAAALWLGRDRIARRMNAPSSSDNNRGALALGAGLMAVELPTAVPYFAAIAAILAEHLALVTEIALLLLYNVMFVAPLIALAAVRRVADERAVARLEAVGGWLRSRAALLLAALLAVAGVGVATVGVAGLI
jgi:cytochrome c biogenesis protein CcdA